MTPAGKLREGDEIRLPGVADPLTVTFMYAPYLGRQTLNTSDGLERRFPADWPIDTPGVDRV